MGENPQSETGGKDYELPYRKQDRTVRRSAYPDRGNRHGKRTGGDSLKEAEKRLSDMALLIKNVTTYQKTKPLYEAYRKARNKEKYRAEHERGIILHEAAAKALKAALIGGKLPSVPALPAEYEKLQGQKESLYADYVKLKKQVQEYDIIKRNIDSILQAEKQPERKRETER